MRNRPPRILQLITTLQPGGAENQLLALTRHLRGGNGGAPRFEIEVGYFKGTGSLAPDFAALGVPVHRLDIRGRLDPGCWRRTRRLVEDRRPDLVVTHLFKADVYGAAAARAHGVPVVSHKHNEDTYLLRFPWGLVGRRTARRARRIISISDAVTRFFVERAGFDPAPFVRIHHGIDPPPAAAPVDRGAFGLPQDALVIGTVARLTEQKGLDILLRAAESLASTEPRFRLVVVGEGEDEAALRAQAAGSGLAGVVHFAGFRSDVAAVLATLDAFVLPSRWEGFGIVLLEAMGQGAPIVATRVGGIPEVIRDGETGRLVAPEDPAALADAIADVWRAPDRTRAMVDAARRDLATRFSAARMAEETATVYNDAIRRAPE